MSKRVISGIIGGFFVLIILFFNQNQLWLLNLITAVIGILAINEIFTVLNISSVYQITIPTFIFIPILPLIGYSFSWESLLYLYTLMIFSITLYNKQIKLDTLFIVYSMTLLISFSMFKIVDLRHYGNFDGTDYGSFYVFLALATAWMSDTGAYFFGKFFGKNKLCPEISPKKTLEGFIGGILVCLISVILISFIFNNFVFIEKKQINYVLVIILGFIGSMISSLGDLFFSTIKRRCNVKDFGNFMPGHGGVLDRFDSVIFVVPYVYMFLKFLPIIY